MRSGTRITTILFDVGGTLLHLDYFFLSRHLHRAGIQVSARAIRRAEYAAKAEIDRRMLSAVSGTDDSRRRPYFAALLDQLGVRADTTAQLIAQLDAAHAQDNLWRLMMPSTPHVLAALRERGLTLGVVSNSDGRIPILLRRHGIEQFFAVIIDSHEVEVEKPDPRIFHLALAQAEASPEQAIFVGDIYSIDVIGAARVGMRPLLLDLLGCYTGVAGEKIRHLRELTAILEGG
ncbi:MAG: HAD family hydrolase [Candidatus Binatia bacterium]